ncbi:MAG: trigger factor [Bacteroidales bacterium]|nr:trigger factor [Bacteroidales bacterium]MCF8391116.1 trigger factor [Bacteroidales bacterium]
MNITKELIDDLNAVVTVKVEEQDYQEKVEGILKDYRKTASMKGFRPGKVPVGMIRKMYYKPVLVDEINKLVSENLMNFIRNEKIQILGEPMPNESDMKIPDFDNDKEYSFKFDIGISPEFDSDISEKDKIVFYNIKVEDEVVEEQLDEVSKRFGELKPVEKASKDELIKGNLREEKPEGLYVEDVSMSIDMMKDEKQKKLFAGKTAGEKVIFNIKKAYPSDSELAALLKIEKAKIKDIADSFEIEIKEVLKFSKHEINQELFDKVYGEGVVKSLEEFKAKIAGELQLNYERESNYKFALDSKEYIIKKSKIELPSEFLKRWIVAANENITAESIEEDFKNYEDEFKWQLIKNKMVKANNISVSEEELFEYAFILSRNQFYQYGLTNIPDEHIENYTREQLAKPEEARRLREQKFDEKIIAFMKETVKLDKKNISMDKFRKLFEEDK